MVKQLKVWFLLETLFVNFLASQLIVTSQRKRHSRGCIQNVIYQNTINQTLKWNVSIPYHVWHIYLHLGEFYGKYIWVKRPYMDGMGISTHSWIHHPSMHLRGGYGCPYICPIPSYLSTSTNPIQSSNLHLSICLPTILGEPSQEVYVHELSTTHSHSECNLPTLHSS